MIYVSVESRRPECNKQHGGNFRDDHEEGQTDLLPLSQNRNSANGQLISEGSTFPFFHTCMPVC